MIRFPHIHWHRLAGVYGLFLQPFYECRCGSRKFGVWY
jgi:hypothetical protein